MPVSNAIIAERFDEIADMLEILGENVFRVRAYRRAAETVRNLQVELEKMHRSQDERIEDLPGIGKDLHDKIVELVETGACEMHAQLLGKLSPGILDILKVRGIGPKKVKLFYEQLGVSNLEQLRSAAESGALASLAGMGKKSEVAILEALNQATQLGKRIPYDEAHAEAEAYLAHLRNCPLVKQCMYAGSLRRKKETIGDVDLLVEGDKAQAIFDHFLAYPKIVQVLGQGDTKASVVLEGNLQIDLRVVPAESYGAALLYFTGSKQFNIRLRTLALKKGLKINEYGIFRGEEKLAGRTEEDMFTALNLEFVPPEQRNE
jgi:DNA polymerase (family 10)